MELFEKLGIDWRMLIAQMINFGILLFILHRYVYRPLIGMLEKREAMIEKSVTDARAIEERLKGAEAGYEEIMTKARVEAAQMLEMVEKTAEQRRSQALEKTKEDVRQIVEQTRSMLAREKEQLLEDVRSDVARLVVSATRGVLADVVTPKISEELAEKVIHNVSAR